MLFTRSLSWIAWTLACGCTMKWEDLQRPVPSRTTAGGVYLQELMGFWPPFSPDFVSLSYINWEHCITIYLPHNGLPSHNSQSSKASWPCTKYSNCEPTQNLCFLFKQVISGISYSNPKLNTKVGQDWVFIRNLTTLMAVRLLRNDIHK